VLQRPVESAQYVSLVCGQRCRQAGIAQSMGARGDCYDNAVKESFFASLEKDLLRRRSFRTRQEARSEVFDYIEVFYNRERLHSTLGYRSPEEYERDHERSDCLREDEPDKCSHAIPVFNTNKIPVKTFRSSIRLRPG
jgi:putative transposase